MIFIVGSLEFVQDQEAGSDGWGNEEDLHDGVVERDIGSKQVKVASQKDQHEQDLWTTWKQMNVFSPRKSNSGLKLTASDWQGVKLSRRPRVPLFQL